MGNTAQIIWSMIFGSIGLGFFIYGKKQKAFVRKNRNTEFCFLFFRLNSFFR